MARQCAGLALALALLAGCSDDSGPPVGAVGHVTTYYGGAAAEEPHATLAGRDVLSAGGTAADAAVAMYFTLAVTLPSAAGLGGGGVCIYFDNAKSEARTLDFIARAPHPAPPGRWPAAVPGTVRGMFALQARYGRLRWEQLIQPAEALARFGVPASRALASVLQGAPVLSDPRAAREFGGAGGKGLAEGEMLRRVDLAGTLARIRAAGAGDFYNGALARSYVDGIAAIGGSVSIDDMRSYHPVWRETITGKFGSKEVHFPPSPVTGGRIAAAIWAKLGDNDAFSGLAPGARERVLVDTAREAYAGAWARPEAGGGSAGFIVMDREGSAAACTVSMNRPFGSGKMIPGMGFLAVRPPQDAATALLGMVPMVIANHNIKQAFMAATGAGDALAPVALMDSVLRATSGKTTVANAVAAPRAAPGAKPDVTLVEQNAPSSIKQAFTGPGVKTTPSIGRVLMMYCPGGIYLEPRSCAVSADPRGFGYAVNAEQ